jgi:alginate O-acetyltransferase complex protein AlgI
VLVLALLVALLPGSFVLGRVLEAGRGRAAGVTRFAVMAVAGPYAAVLVAAGTFSPFLYYQF